MVELEEVFNLFVHNRNLVYCSSYVLLRSPLDEANTTRYQVTIQASNINNV